MTAEHSDGVAFRGSIAPRYTDQDTWRHVNNSRAYQLHIEARIQDLVNRFGPDAWFSDAERLRPLRTRTQFPAMSFYGDNIDFTVSIQACDQHQIQLRTCLHQKGQLVGIQDCVMGAFLNHQRVDIPVAMQDSYGKDAVASPEALPEAPFAALAERFDGFPRHLELTPRYADLDADAQRSEAALARYMEHARTGALNQVSLGGYGLLIAAMDVGFFHYRRSGQPVELVTGVGHLGNTSFQLVGGARNRHGVHAMAQSVMVMVDLDTNRPVPLTDDVRAQLEKLRIPGS